MKIGDLLERLKDYPPESELEILGDVSKDPCMSYIKGTYIPTEFDFDLLGFCNQEDAKVDGRR